MSKKSKNKSGHTSTYFMLAQKKLWWKDIFCDLCKKDKSGVLQKAFVRDMFLSFLHRSRKMSFHNEFFYANTKNVDAYLNFFSEIFDILKKNKNVLPNGYSCTHEPKRRLRIWIFKHYTYRTIMLTYSMLQYFPILLWLEPWSASYIGWFSCNDCLDLHVHIFNIQQCYHCLFIL